jgi:PhnB protein
MEIGEFEWRVAQPAAVDSTCHTSADRVTFSCRRGSQVNSDAEPTIGFEYPAARRGETALDRASIVRRIFAAQEVKAMATNPVPAGFHTVTPYLYTPKVAEFIDFAKRAFGAQQIEYHDMGGGHVHGDIRIGDSHIMIGGAPSQPASLYLYVPDVDAMYRKAIAAGAKSVQEPNNKFYGDRSAWVTDPFGFTWFIATHVEDVSEDDMRRRSAAQAHA